MGTVIAYVSFLLFASSDYVAKYLVFSVPILVLLDALIAIRTIHRSRG